MTPIPALVLSIALCGPALADGIAIMPVKLLDTSHEVQDQTANHARRQAMMARLLGEGLPGTVPIDAETVAAACAPETPECLFQLARDKGADSALFITVHKSSTLIMQLFATLSDTESGKVIVNRDMSFRGDNDVSWRRAALYLLRELEAR